MPRATQPLPAVAGEIAVPGPEDGLHARIAYVQSTMGGIEKNSTVNTGTYTYSYIDDSRIFAEVRARLSPLGVATYVSVESEEQRGPLSVVRVRVTFAYKAETFSVNGVGYGGDRADKGAGKAITSAVRYVFTKTFLQGGDADPEREWTQITTEAQLPAAAAGKSPDAPPNTSGRRGRSINAAQLRLVWARASDAGVSEEGVHYCAARTLGRDDPSEISMTDFPSDKLDELIEKLGAYGDWLKRKSEEGSAA